MRRHILHNSIFLVALFFAALPTRAFAALQITELMYDPPSVDDKQQWMEVYNTGDTSVTIKTGTNGWHIVDDDTTGASRHPFYDPASASNGGRGPLTIEPHTFAVFAHTPADFMSAYGGSYSVIKSAFAPKTAGATVLLLDENDTVIDRITYTKDMGGYNDGNSLHRLSDGTLVAAAPDPGVNTGNYVVSSGSSPNTSGTSSSTSQSGSNTTTPAADVNIDASVVNSTADVAAVQSGSGASPTLGARITVPSVVSVGAGSFFSGQALTAKGALIAGARYLWNFGYGATAEGQTVFHTYPYPGTYAVVLTVSSDTSAGVAEVHVTAAEAQVGMLAEPDGSLVLVNQSAQNLNVGLWTISFASSTFVLPKDTIVLGRQSLHFAVDTLGMRVGTDVILRYPNSMLAATAAPSVLLGHIAPSTSSLTEPVVPYTPTKINMPVSPAATPTSSVTTASPNKRTQLASVAVSGPSLPSGEALCGLFALLIVGGVGSFYLRREHPSLAQNETYPTVEEFEIE